MQIKQPKPSKKQKLIIQQLRIEPALSSRNVAKQLGVSHVTVEKVKKSKEDFIFHNGKMIKRDVLLQMIEEKESEKNE